MRGTKANKMKKARDKRMIFCRAVVPIIKRAKTYTGISPTLTAFFNDSCLEITEARGGLNR